MGFEGQVSAKPMVINGCETPAYQVPLNDVVAQFIDDNPEAALFVNGDPRIHTGELEEVNLKDSEEAMQVRMLADNCSSILKQASDEHIKQQACESVVETVIRLQNPKYATDQIEVRNEAFLMHGRFEDDRRLLVQTRQMTQERADQLIDPSVELLQDLDTHIKATYDVEAMREQAIFTLLPMIDRATIQNFIEITGVVPELDNSIIRAVKKLGSFVSSRFVQLRIA